MEIFSDKLRLLLLGVLPLFLILRILLRTSVPHLLVRLWRSVEDRCHAYQFFTVPQFNEQLQENHLYRKVSVYLSSLSSLEDSDFTNLLSGPKSNDIVVRPDPERPVLDRFLGAEVSWKSEGLGGNRSLVLRIRKRDKRRILKSYLQHIFTVSEEIEQNTKEIRLFTNSGPVEGAIDGRWRSVPFTHPATIDTIVMDGELKVKVKSDLEAFLKSKQYYHRLGRVWKRSYLLHGPSGTGKSSFIAAMAKLLCYDVYDVDMSRVLDDSDLKLLLMQTASKSIVVVEDLDRFLLEKKSTAVSLSGLLSFMDGVISCCGEERVMVFTMNGQDRVDEAVTRPGRIDVQINFPLCDFTAFKSLANSYLGLKEHKLFPQVEEMFQTGASLSPAHIGEIMIANRSSPSRALKSVIGALQTVNANKVGQQRLSGSTSGRSSEESSEPASVFCRESVHTVREFRKLYGLLKMGSRRKESIDLSSAEKEGSKHEA
ncbi:AAA-ATPase At2g46620-like [Punica granatum]|uniref:AAA+ ATPase domain-containing protein n=2 Tax=Punica granatum TaxID=22663 RepID=A0A218WRQ6_PUNGR|nr:AAA-ATPase At2g46620-like [Punica granatum]OWM75524.1 hypothetical protein CDL15_Pgr021688 [Punica granatum]PKI76413.1 hypothetical protein CRG98_003208 [Punica granatum]